MIQQRVLFEEDFLSAHDVQTGCEPLDSAAGFALEYAVEAVDVIGLGHGDVHHVGFFADGYAHLFDKILAVGVEVTAEAAAGHAGCSIDVVELVAGDVVVASTGGH